MKLKHLLITLIAAGTCIPAAATPVKVTMNTTSPTMTLATADGTPVETGEPASRVYNFDIPEGDYVLTAYATNGTTVNGTIKFNPAEISELAVLTNTLYVSNKDEDGTQWSIEEGDYTVDYKVSTREGNLLDVTLGKSSTAKRYTLLALNGNTVYMEFIPGAAREAEGYVPALQNATLTFGRTFNTTIYKGYHQTVTIPSDAELSIGYKTVHFADFNTVAPESTEDNGDTRSLTYYLSSGQTYNFRTWRPGGLTLAGQGVPTEFTDADYASYDPAQVNHDPASNKGYETGDIFVNINAQGHLKLNVGDTFDAHAMRTWQLTDNSTNNYFMEPDFHYTVVGLDGKPSSGVIEIDNADTRDSHWSTIKAVGNGTAIVLVTYDAISVSTIKNGVRNAYLGGEYWGAIWPENTGVYVVTVGEEADGIEPNMLLNEEYNKDTLKLAGNNVDAEHDVFYYLDTEEGAYYTFTPEGVEDVTIAYPAIGSRTVSYSGFGSEGVTANADGSYTLLLRHGRQIVRLTDASGKSVYQVLTAKECHREITNESRPGATDFIPGDKVIVQYSGLFHPANKLAGIYNMSAYVTYNGNPNGTSLILSANQYTFGSAPKAQAVTFNIPEDYDAEANPEFILDGGVIQVNGYGDPIGNHRTIDRFNGRSPNFTAIAHKTYFGAIPEVRIPVSINTSGIDSVTDGADAEVVAYYNLQGIASDSPRKGMNIVVYSDGTTRKLMVR